MRALTMPAGDFPYGNTIGLDSPLPRSLSFSLPFFARSFLRLLPCRRKEIQYLSLSFLLLFVSSRDPSSSSVPSSLTFIKMHRAEEQRGGHRSIVAPITKLLWLVVHPPTLTTVLTCPNSTPATLRFSLLFSFWSRRTKVTGNATVSLRVLSTRWTLLIA